MKIKDKLQGSEMQIVRSENEQKKISEIHEKDGRELRERILKLENETAISSNRVQETEKLLRSSVNRSNESFKEICKLRESLKKSQSEKKLLKEALYDTTRPKTAPRAKLGDSSETFNGLFYDDSRTTTAPASSPIRSKYEQKLKGYTIYANQQVNNQSNLDANEGEASTQLVDAESLDSDLSDSMHDSIVSSDVFGKKNAMSSNVNHASNDAVEQSRYRTTQLVDAESLDDDLSSMIENSVLGKKNDMLSNVNHASYGAVEQSRNAAGKDFPSIKTEFSKEENENQDAKDASYDFIASGNKFNVSDSLIALPRSPSSGLQTNAEVSDGLIVPAGSCLSSTELQISKDVASSLAESTVTDTVSKALIECSL